MSLTSILETPEARAFLAEIVHRPPGLVGRPPRVAPVAKNPRFIGTAFDYALRFGLAARGWAPVRDIVAFEGVKLVAQRSTADLWCRAAGHLDAAFEVLAQYGEDLTMSDEEVRACCWLSRLDWLYRSGANPRALEEAMGTAELDEIHALLAIVPWERFRPTTRMALNPGFGPGSLEVGGADADLVVDNRLIEVKTVKDPSVPIGTVRQLVGYAVLARRWGVEGRPNWRGIDDLGIYLSRAGELVTFRLEDCIDIDDEADILNFLLLG